MLCVVQMTVVRRGEFAIELKLCFHADKQLFKELLFHWLQWENSLLPYWANMHLNVARSRKALTLLSQGVIFEGLSGVVIVEWSIWMKMLTQH